MPKPGFGPVREAGILPLMRLPRRERETMLQAREFTDRAIPPADRVRPEDCCGICGREADSLNWLTEAGEAKAGTDRLCDECCKSVFDCEDCNGAGMVPAIGPEEGEADGYVPCPKCREGGVA